MNATASAQPVPLKIPAVWVSETFYQRFVANLDTSGSTLLQKLAATTPKSRGRNGLSRHMTDLTHAEYNELYIYAAEGRANQKNIHGVPSEEFKATTLNAAICGGNLADRMERLGGLDAVIPYEKKKRGPRKPKAVEETTDNASDSADDTQETTDVAAQAPEGEAVAPTEGTNLQRVDEDEVTGEDAEAIGRNIAAAAAG